MTAAVDHPAEAMRFDAEAVQHELAGRMMAADQARERARWHRVQAAAERPTQLAGDVEQLPHVLAAALAHAIEAHHQLSAAVAATCDAASVRDVARLLGVTPGTAQRWRTTIPGTEALAAALQSARDNGAA